MNKVAYKVKDVSDKFKGEAWLYKVSDVVEEDGASSEYIVSSAVEGPNFFGGFICETYLFLSDSDGNVLRWGELEGSFKGGMDCDQAIKRAGYEIIEGEADGNEGSVPNPDGTGQEEKCPIGNETF